MLKPAFEKLATQSFGQASMLNYVTRSNSVPSVVNFRPRIQKSPYKVTLFQIAPWSRVATDQFKLHGKDCIVHVDYHSDFIELKDLQENTSFAVIEFLKEQFSRYGMPDRLVTVNGPQYRSEDFRQFSPDWEFFHVSSSPYHHRSNGKVDSAVKVVKSLLKKARKDNRDLWLAMSDQRNTPTESLGTSPAQRLMSRRTRTVLTTATSLLYPNVPDNVPEMLKLKKAES